MAEMHSILKDNLDKIRDLCSRYQVKNLFAFGSVCTDNFNEDSDVDLLVTFYPMDFGKYADTFFEFAEILEQLLQRPIDLITDKSLENPYFIKTVNQTKTLLYG